MFVKPLARFLLDVAIWEGYLLCQAVSCSPDILCDCYLRRKRALGSLFSYAALIVHQSDFYIARDAHPDTLREQDGECQGSPTAGVQPQQEQWWLVRQPDAEGGSGRSHLCGHVRIGDLVAGPERQIAKSAAAAEQPSESYHRAA